MALSDILKKYGGTTGIEGIMTPSTSTTQQQVYNSSTNTVSTVQGVKYTGPTATIAYGTAEKGYPRMLREIEQGELPQFDQTQFAKKGTGKVEIPTYETTTTTTPTVETKAEAIVDPCPAGYKYDREKGICVPIDIPKKDDKDVEPELINKPRDMGATAKATTAIANAAVEQGALQTPFGQDVSLTIDNTSLLSNFGMLGKVLDEIFIKGPADKRLLEFGKFTDLSTEGISANKNQDGTVNVRLTETGKYNFGQIQTNESLAGRLATTQKTYPKGHPKAGNIIKAPNGQNMIVGPIQVNTFGKTTGQTISDAQRKQALKEAMNKDKSGYYAKTQGQSTKDTLLSEREGKVATGVTRPGGGGGTTYTSKTVSKAELDKQKADNEAAIDAFLSKNVTEADKEAAKKTTGSGASKQGGGGKIVCTMMNESYGFGSFRNKIWLAHSRNLSKEYEVGYHTLFLPLVNYSKQKGFSNTVVKKVLEHIARHRTVDIRKQQYNKVDVLGRTYRTILEPLCYITGRIILWKKK